MKLWKTIVVAIAVPLAICLAVAGYYFFRHYNHRNLFFNLGEVVPGRSFRE
jgi:hypothetical protein